jgi:hypothetical protein
MGNVNRYRQYASDCVRLAGQINGPTSKAVLLDMARAWVRLSEQAEKNSQLDLVYESPSRPEGAVAPPEQNPGRGETVD